MNSRWRSASAALVVCLALGSSAAAFASEADALAILANIKAKHLPYGTILDPTFSAAESSRITDYTRCGDSAIWTGHYLAAESFRYAVTHSPDALANVKEAIAGLQALSDVTGTNLLARCLIPQDSPYAASIASQESANGIYTNSSAGYIWVGNTSRDEFIGAFFGLSVAYDLVNDASVRSAVSSLVTRLKGFLSGHNWSVTMPDGSTSTTFLTRPDQILMILLVAQHINPSTFSAGDQLLRPTLVSTMITPVRVDALSNSSYFKFNLDYDTLYNLIRLENGDSLSVYREAYSVLRTYTASHQNAYFDMIDRALSGPDANRDAETQTLLDELLLRPPRDQYIDDTLLVKVCGSEACAPIPVPQRPPTDFLWQRDPFQLAGGGSGTIESSGIDYILPYWMSRYYGITAPFVAQSAAAASPAVAPGSLGSLYGANLAAGIDQAQTQPLPTSLNGVSLTVTDSAGVSTPLPLLYVSPGQINFAVPAGVASGAATFTLSNGGVKTAAPGVVWPVVPRLFTLNATGLAAASAVSIDFHGMQTPVDVSTCNVSGCEPVPITVAGTAVYLSLYGTGIRNVAALSDVKAAVNGISVPVAYAGPQTQFTGVDQVNIKLPATLQGSGPSSVVLTVNGQTSNPVVIDIE